VTLLGFGWTGEGILLNLSIQSPELIAVWTLMQPPPLVVSTPGSITAGLMPSGLRDAGLDQRPSAARPQGIGVRALGFTALSFVLSDVFEGS